MKKNKLKYILGIIIGIGANYLFKTTNNTSLDIETYNTIGSLYLIYGAYNLYLLNNEINKKEESEENQYLENIINE